MQSISLEHMKNYYAAEMMSVDKQGARFMVPTCNYSQFVTYLRKSGRNPIKIAQTRDKTLIEYRH